MRVIAIGSSEYEMLSDKISKYLRFDPSKEDWLTLPDVCKKYRLNSLWEEEREMLAQDILIKAGLKNMIAADIHHDYFEFDVCEHIPCGYWSMDTKRGCNVYFPTYYPDGDYHFFFTVDMTRGLFGHPWREEIYVLGEPLVRTFDEYSVRLDITEL